MSKKVNQASQGATKTVGDAGKGATSAASQAGNNVTNTASGAVGNLKQTGTDTWGAASKGDLKGAFGGVAKGAGQTVGGVGSGAGKTVDDAGKGANKLVGGVGKNLGACETIRECPLSSWLTIEQETQLAVLLARLSATPPETLARPCRTQPLVSARLSETPLALSAKAT